jgi:hypothetical protein
VGTADTDPGVLDHGPGDGGTAGLVSTGQLGDGAGAVEEAHWCGELDHIGNRTYQCRVCGAVWRVRDGPEGPVAEVLSGARHSRRQCAKCGRRTDHLQEAPGQPWQCVACHVQGR